MKRPIKAVVFDIDDTIFDMKTKKFIPSSIEAIKELEKKGIAVILATGRPLKTALVINELGVKAKYYVCTNGSLIVDDNGDIISSKVFKSNLVERIYQYCLKNDIGLLFKFPDKVYEYIHKEVFENFYNKTPTTRNDVVFGVTDEHLKNCPLGGCLATSRDKTKEFNEVFAGECKAVIIDDESSDIILADVSKKTGVEEVLKLMGISPANCMSFGDNDNDIEINDFVAIGVAVGNCSDELKKHADYITDTIQNDGVKKALQYYGLI